MWIAFIFQYLWDTKQRHSKWTAARIRCELLSFFSIFGIQNNTNRKTLSRKWVVNCFHFSVSLGYKTTLWVSLSVNFTLWIAFIFQYLWDTKQLLVMLLQFLDCCELLSFFSIFGIQNNLRAELPTSLQVVNCFHFSVSLGYKTTDFIDYYEPHKLWIAFIFQYLWDTKQLMQDDFVSENCCELLSFFSIFGIQNNISFYRFFISFVVNCFHFSVSLGYKTTAVLCFQNQRMLWIAFIFQYLWDTKQLFALIAELNLRCELLSFFSIFGIQNNW